MDTPIQFTDVSVRNGSDMTSSVAAGTPKAGWILFDGECRFCIATVERFRRMFERRGFAFLPLQTPWVVERFGLDPTAPLEDMRVLTVSGADYGGAEAILFLARQCWWSRPFAWLGKLPLVHRIIVAAYGWVAARRGCVHRPGGTGACEVRVAQPKAEER